MECFDISHTQGIETVASMVVFEHGQPAKKEYRRFKLKTVQGKPDDFKSMAEIMERRYGEKDWPVPDLIIIDGGKGQLHAALPVIRQAGCEAPVISLAKRIEEVFVEGRSDPSSSVIIRRNSSCCRLSATKPTALPLPITAIFGESAVSCPSWIMSKVSVPSGARLMDGFQDFGRHEGRFHRRTGCRAGMNHQAAENVYYFFRLGTDEKRKMTQ